MPSNDNTLKDKSVSIHSGHWERIRERYLNGGLDGFAPHELLEFILTFSRSRGDVNELAHRLIDRFGSLSGVLDADISELLEVEGVGEKTAILLHMLPEIFRKYEIDRLPDTKAFDTVAKIVEFLRARYVGLNFERVYLMLFDNGMHLIDCCHISDGSVNCSAVTVRKIVELCVMKKAACAVLAHNHPKGLAFPSSSDQEMTRTIDSMLSVIGVPLLEHIIITEYGHGEVLRPHKGMLRASPMSEGIDEGFYLKFYGEESSIH